MRHEKSKLPDIIYLPVLCRNNRPGIPSRIKDSLSLYHTLPWATFSKSNFPYSLRQSAGCGNALGVVKFDLTDPFDVHMHDTNLKSAFTSANRYYSHGCIRLEKPVPVLVVYITVEADEGGKTVWHKDIYHLLANK